VVQGGAHVVYAIPDQQRELYRRLFDDQSPYDMLSGLGIELANGATVTFDPPLDRFVQAG